MTTNRKPVLLIVDDTPENIDALRAILSADYALKVATNGALAVKIAKTAAPDLILLDVMMPGMNGYEVCRLLKASEETRHVPVIFVTTIGDIDAETRGFAMGAEDYITKPISPSIVLARVKTHLALYKQRRHLECLVKERTAEIEKSNRQLIKTHHAVIAQLGRAAEYRDNETGLHIVRVGYLSQMLARAAGFTEERADLMTHASKMHDIGKIGIPDHVLLKPGKLTPQEFDIIKAHPVIGAEIIGVRDSELLVMAREIALTHHEKWDGSGYPYGLQKEDIPITGRIVALVDVFDALTSCRPYKKSWSAQEAFQLIRDSAGKHFDPALAQLFLDHADDVLDVLAKYGDAVQTFAPPGDTSAEAIAATRKLPLDAPAIDQAPVYGGNATPHGLVTDLGAPTLRSERLLWSGPKSHRSVTWYR